MKVLEIFKSVSGEIGRFPQGTTCAFIRFSGCNLKCPYCDTKESQLGLSGKHMDIPSILNAVEALNTSNIVITGGEPFVQAIDDLTTLVRTLLNAGKYINIETNGTFNPFPHSVFFSEKISIIMDYKLGAMESTIPLLYIGALRKQDFVKCCYANQTELETALALHTQYRYNAVDFAYSPLVFNNDFTKDPPISYLLKRLNELQLDGIINIQLHKVLNLK